VKTWFVVYIVVWEHSVAGTFCTILVIAIHVSRTTSLYCCYWRLQGRTLIAGAKRSILFLCSGVSAVKSALLQRVLTFIQTVHWIDPDPDILSNKPLLHPLVILTLKLYTSFQIFIDNNTIFNYILVLQMNDIQHSLVEELYIYVLIGACRI
jgi:hypothetical protein